MSLSAPRPKKQLEPPVPPHLIPPPGASGSLSLALKKIVGNGVLLVVVFWAVAMWLYGTFYRGTENAYKLRVLVADFDGGEVGAALISAIRSVNGQSEFPTFHIYEAKTTSPEELQRMVFHGTAWGTIYASVGASSAFQQALASESLAATYNASAAWVYAGLEVRYITVWEGFILSSFEEIIGIATDIFAATSVVPRIAGLNSTTSLSVKQASVLATPVGSTYVNLAPFPLGVRVVLNTVGFVFPVLFQFFFLMGFNGIFTAEGIYQKASLRDHFRFRLPISLVWTLVTGLSIIAWALVYSNGDGYHVEAKNFFALWAVSWVNAAITFDLIDIALTFVPLPFMSPIVVSFIILSASSTIYPIEVMNRFFRVHYAFPPHATWSVMITIWGKGCTNTLYYNLPILAAWIVVSKVGVFFSVRTRVKRHVGYPAVANELALEESASRVVTRTEAEESP